MAGIHNYTWAQGEDLVMSLVYKQGPAGAEVPVDLTGYSVRMDLALPSGERIYTFNSEPLADVDPVEPGATPDNVTEIEGSPDDSDAGTPGVFGPGGEINIYVPRSVTLPGGEAFAYLNQSPPVLVYNYDVFIRDSLDRQKKILQGQVSIEKSVTLWP